MTSAIDPTKPTAGNALTQDVRDNFQTAADEISALQDAQAPPFNGPDILGAMLGVTCDGTGEWGGGVNGGHAYRKYAWGQNCVITAVYACNPSVPLSGIDFTLTSLSGEIFVTDTINLPNVADTTNAVGGSVQLFTDITSANMNDQYGLTITTPGPAGSTCDVYILGFPMQPLQ